MSSPLERDVRPLVARVEALLPVVTRLAHAVYAARWALEDAAHAAHVSDEVYGHLMTQTGMEALEAVMNELTCQAAAGVDFYLLDEPPLWFTAEQCLRDIRRTTP